MLGSTIALAQKLTIHRRQSLRPCCKKNQPQQSDYVVVGSTVQGYGNGFMAVVMHFYWEVDGQGLSETVFVEHHLR